MTGRREQRRQISNPTLFGKVAVLFGGTSSERDVSLETGRAVHKALVDRGIDAVLWDPARLMSHMGRDKKVKGGTLTFVLVRGIGDAFISRDVPTDELTAFMEGAVAA